MCRCILFLGPSANLPLVGTGSSGLQLQAPCGYLQHQSFPAHLLRIVDPDLLRRDLGRRADDHY